MNCEKNMLNHLEGTNRSNPHSFSTALIATWPVPSWGEQFEDGDDGVDNNRGDGDHDDADVDDNNDDGGDDEVNLTDHLVSRIEPVGDRVLVDVQGRQPQGNLVLQLGGKTLLNMVMMTRW